MRGLARSLVVLAIVLGAVYGVLRATCLSFWTVAADDPLVAASLLPTLEPGDLVVLWRLGTPAFGDLVRCSDPETSGRYVIGRILGEQGDAVNITGHAVTVNRRLIATAHACPVPRLTVPHPVSADPVDLLCEIEAAGGNDYARARLEVPPSIVDIHNTSVPNGHVFLASDDRAFHYDSREFGTVPRSTCTERIAYRLWSARGWSDEARRMTLLH